MTYQSTYVKTPDKWSLVRADKANLHKLVTCRHVTCCSCPRWAWDDCLFQWFVWEMTRWKSLNIWFKNVGLKNRMWFVWIIVTWPAWSWWYWWLLWRWWWLWWWHNDDIVWRKMTKGRYRHRNDSLSCHAFVWLHPLFKWTWVQFCLEPSFLFQTWAHIHSTMYLHPCLKEVVDSNIEGSWTLTSAKISQAIVVCWGMDSLHHSKNYAKNGVARGLRTKTIL